MKDPHGEIRLAAAETLCKLGDRRCTPVLLKLLNSPRHDDDAALALKAMKDPRAVAPLIALARDNSRAGHIALEVLRAYGPIAVAPILKAIRQPQPRGPIASILEPLSANAIHRVPWPSTW